MYSGQVSTAFLRSISCVAWELSAPVGRTLDRVECALRAIPGQIQGDGSY